MIIKVRTIIKLKYKSQGRAPINPNCARDSVATNNGAIVHGLKKRVTINPVKNAPSGEVIF